MYMLENYQDLNAVKPFYDCILSYLCYISILPEKVQNFAG